MSYIQRFRGSFPDCLQKLADFINEVASATAACVDAQGKAIDALEADNADLRKRIEQLERKPAWADPITPTVIDTIEVSPYGGPNITCGEG